MTNYNDGNWHGWAQDGACPVHHNAKVDVFFVNGIRSSGYAHNFDWCDEGLEVFRVIKEDKKPAEMMIGKGFDGSLVAFVVGEWSDLSAYKAKGFIHVREVLE